jgi:hypothetical protein
MEARGKHSALPERSRRPAHYPGQQIALGPLMPGDLFTLELGGELVAIVVDSWDATGSFTIRGHVPTEAESQQRAAADVAAY